MSTAEDMALAFMAAHPEGASRTLTHLPPSDAARVLLDAPLEVSARILAAMTPLYAARCLDACDAREAARLIDGLPALPAKAVLGLLSAEGRNSLLGHLPKTKSAAIRQLLDHPTNSVGSHVDSRVGALPGTDTVSDALDLLSKEPAIYAGAVYVLGNSRNLTGLVPIGLLLSSPADAHLASLAAACPRVLSSLAPLSSVIGLTEWEHDDVLPVIDADQRFVGVLHHSSTTPRVVGEPFGRTSSVLGSVLAAMAGAYRQGATDVIDALIPQQPKRGGAHEP